ncbi:MAK10-like protein [Tanacetum coccineum]
MASQDARLSKFEADFKQQQSEMTKKIDIVIKAITDRIAGALPSDMIKNLKLSTSLVLSACSYPKIDPQCSSHPSTSINSIKAHSKEATISQISLLRLGMEIETQQPEEPEPTLEDEFQDFHLNLPVLEVLDHALIYNAILDKYVESLELEKNGSAFVQEEIPAKMEDHRRLLTVDLGEYEPFDTLADLGLRINIIPLYLFKKLNIGLLEETNHIFGLADGTKSYPVGIIKDVEVRIGKLKLLNDFYVIDIKKDPKTTLLVGRGFLATTNAEEEAPYWTTLGKRESYKPRPCLDGVGVRTPYYARKGFLDCHLPKEWEIARDAELNSFKDVLVFRRMVEILGAIPINLKSNMWESEDLIKNSINKDKPPKNGDGAWHAKIRLIDLDGEEFTKTLQSIPNQLEALRKRKVQGNHRLDHFFVN